MNTKAKAAFPLTEQRFKVHKFTRFPIGHPFNPPIVGYTVVDIEEGHRVLNFKRRWAAWLFAAWLEAGRQSVHLDWI